MINNYRKSFLVISVFLFLLPIFFIPGGALALGDAKVALIVVGVIALGVTWLWEFFKTPTITVPWSPVMILVLLLPLVYLVSALTATNPFLSLFSYNFEVGTFGFILLATLLLIIISFISSSAPRILQALSVIFASLSIIIVFAVVKILSGGFPDWGVFRSITDSSVGGWTDLATILGLFVVLAVVALGILPIKKSWRFLAYGLLGLALVLMLVINFSSVFIFTLVIALLTLIYFRVWERQFFISTSISPELPEPKVTGSSKLIWLPLIVAAISLVALINPEIPGRGVTLGEWLTSTANTSNSIVRPSFSATLDVSKAVLSQAALLGSGPNTFSYEWLVYKPVEVNGTPFWGVTFPFGIGFIPTQISATGLLGTLVWLAFFAILAYLLVKALSNLPESRVSRLALVSTLAAVIYLWMASFIYSPSITVLTLAFIFSGLFIAASMEAGIVSTRVFSWSQSNYRKSLSAMVIIPVILVLAFLGWTAFGRTVAAFHFKNAINLANSPEAPLDAIEHEVSAAIELVPADIYYAALSRINFLKAQRAASDTSGTQAENQAIFQDAIQKTVEAGRLSVEANPRSSQNWVSLGIIYSALVPAPLSVEGAYDNAKVAFDEALKRNPFNPEIPLLLAQLELNRGNIEATRDYLAETLRLKDDYADAYLMIARLAVAQNNLPEAIAATERLVALAPGNASLLFDLGLLKYSSADFAGSAEVLTAALTIVPDYANARYYLGLSLIQLGRSDEALTHFEALAQSNPDNKELESIIQSLKAGKSTSQ